MDRRTFLHGLMTPLIAGGNLCNAQSAIPGIVFDEQPSRTLARYPSTANGGRGESRSIHIGLPDLDWSFGDLRDGMPVVIAGRPSMCKTSLALAAAAHVAVRLHLPVTIFGAPLNELEIRARMISFLARIDLRKVQFLLDQADTGPAMHAAHTLASAPLLIDDRPFLTTAELATETFLNNAQTGLRNGLTVVLAPELLTVEPKFHRDLPGRSSLVGALRDLGETHGGAVLCELPLGCETHGGAVLCELPLGRAVEERDNKWPRLADLEGFSREFARDADAVLLIHRPVIYDPSAEPEYACVITARNRYGRCGGTSLVFERNGGFANYPWPISHCSQECADD